MRHADYEIVAAIIAEIEPDALRMQIANHFASGLYTRLPGFDAKKWFAETGGLPTFEMPQSTLDMIRHATLRSAIEVNIEHVIAKYPETAGHPRPAAEVEMIAAEVRRLNAPLWRELRDTRSYSRRGDPDMRHAG